MSDARVVLRGDGGQHPKSKHLVAIFLLRHCLADSTLT